MNLSGLILVLILGLVVVLILTTLVSRVSKPRINKEYFIKHWQSIEALGSTESAVIKADSVLDEALKRASIKGSTMGERLNNSRGIIKDIQGTWVAHKLRNQFVHEPDTKATPAQCHYALGRFKKALKDIGAL